MIGEVFGGGDKAGRGSRVTPAKAGVQFLSCAFGALDSGLRRNDGDGEIVVLTNHGAHERTKEELSSSLCKPLLLTHRIHGPRSL
jgi:hypothetical protein